MSVGVALIVRDEEATLAACLDSIRAGVDEIVVVDTGSVDGTVDVARRYTDRIFEFAWIDDFAAARQFAFEQVTSDWVFWLDADDRVRGAEHLRGLTSSAAPEVGGFQWPYVVAWDAWGAPRFTYWRERCVRNDGSYHWAGRIHEVLIRRDGAAAREMIQVPAIVVEHRPEERGVSRDPRRNLRLLEAAVAEQAGSRNLYYLAREYADLGEPDQAIGTFEQYFAVATWDDEHYLARIQVAVLHRGAKRYDAAIDADLQALKVHPRWPDAYFGLAESFYYRREWAKVVHWIELARSLPEPETPLFRDKLRTEYAWIIHYTNALYHLGHLNEALAWTRTALGIDPDDQWHRENLRQFSALVLTPGRL